MKAFISILLLTLTMNTFASGPILSKDVYHPSVVGPVSAYLSKGRPRSINVSYIGHLTNSKKVYLGALLNRKFLGTFEMTLGRGHVLYGYFTPPKGAEGELEIFFVDEEGNYDSDYGHNYRFILQN